MAKTSHYILNTWLLEEPCLNCTGFDIRQCLEEYPYMSRDITKPTKWLCAQRRQISLGIGPDWSESSLCAQWVAKDPRFLHADSEDSDPIGRMPRLICVFSGRTLILLVLSCRGSHHHAHYSKQTQIDVLRLHCSTLNQTDRKFCRKRIIRQLGRDTEQGTLSLLYTLILNISLPRRLSKSWFGAHRFFFRLTPLLSLCRFKDWSEYMSNLVISWTFPIAELQWSLLLR